MVGDRVAGDLEEPGAEAVGLLHRVAALVDAQEDLLEDVVGIRRVVYPPGDEAPQLVAELRPDLLHRLRVAHRRPLRHRGTAPGLAAAAATRVGIPAAGAFAAGAQHVACSLGEQQLASAIGF